MGGLTSGPQTSLPPPLLLPGSGAAAAAASRLQASRPATPGSVSHHSQPLLSPNPCSSSPLTQASPGGTAWFTHPGHSPEPPLNNQGDGGDALDLCFDSDISTHGKGFPRASENPDVGDAGSGIPRTRHRTSAPAAPGQGVSSGGIAGLRLLQASASTGRRHSAVAGMPWIGSNTSLLRMQDATSSDPLPQALGGQAAPPRMRAWHENLISLVATPPDPVCVVLRRLVWPKALGRPQALLPAPSFPLLLPSPCSFLPRLPSYPAHCPARSSPASCLGSTSSNLTPSS